MKLTFDRIRCAAIASLGLLAAGCDRAVVLNPKGPIADAERGLLFDAFTVMLVVIVPVIVMAFLFAWRYRARRNARHEPKWAYSPRIDAVVWAIPALIVVAVAILVWRSTHRLDPYRKLASDVPPLDVQVVAQDWKWLFIYPEQDIAVGQPMVFPGRPADQPAHHLRHGDELVLRARRWPARSTPWPACRRDSICWPTSPARFVGRNTQYSGGGFSDQFFEVAPRPRQSSTPGSPRPGSRRTSSIRRPTRSSPRRAGAHPGDLLFGGRAEPVRHDHREISPRPLRPPDMPMQRPRRRRPTGR